MDAEPRLSGDGPDRDDAWRENYETTVALAVRLDAMRRFLRAGGPFGLQVLVREDVHGRRVLEVGPGSGGHAARLLDRTRARPACWVLLDRSEAMAREAVARVGRRTTAARAVVGEIERLPVADEARFDLIVAMHVLQHVASPLRAVRALAARLAPRGRLLVTTMDSRDGDELRRLVRRGLRSRGLRAEEVARLGLSTATAQRTLRRVFGRVEVRIQRGALEFPAADDAVRYASSMAWLAGFPRAVRDEVHDDIRRAALRGIARDGVFRVRKGSATFLASGSRDARRAGR